MRPHATPNRPIGNTDDDEGVTDTGLILALVIVGAVLLDTFVRPRRARWLPVPRASAGGVWLLMLMTAALFGTTLALSGNLWVAAALALALEALLVLASNAKRAMLGEPLLFSDLALIGAIFRHPQFYLSALREWQKMAIAVVAGLLFAALAWLFVPRVGPHLQGLAIAVVSMGLLLASLRLGPLSKAASTPRAETDVLRMGLLPSLLLYWLRWRATHDPAPIPETAGARQHGQPELIIAIQCESFADPAELFGEHAFTLPGLAAARNMAFQWGDLHVSGFGAYTMRTEYAVLFGREEEDLGFRRYDPFLSAMSETSYALPRRLGTGIWRSLFLHPHDMRFYNRDRIMPEAGFAELVGEERFEPPAPGQGRYVTDAAMTREILALAADAREPTMLYAVTIENHGPWSSPEGSAVEALVQSYRTLVGKGDAMLGDLTAGLRALRRPALLVFFGDHRPSIPGASMPGGDRHTPYVMLRFDENGEPVVGQNEKRDITPATLHHEILRAAQG